MKPGQPVEFTCRDMKGAGTVVRVDHCCVEIKPSSLMVYTGWGWVQSFSRENVVMFLRNCRALEVA